VPGAIVSANVGGSAGGIVIPEPQEASYATWPVFTQKTIEDVLAIWKDNHARENAGLAGRQDNRVPPGGVEGNKVTAAIFSRDTFLLLGALLVAIVGLRLLRS
jgi:hypothetical protein